MGWQPAPQTYLSRVFRYAAPIDHWVSRYCGCPPWQAQDTDGPACGALDRCPHCGFDGDEQRLYRSACAAADGVRRI